MISTHIDTSLEAIHHPVVDTSHRAVTSLLVFNDRTWFPHSDTLPALAFLPYLVAYKCRSVADTN